MIKLTQLEMQEFERLLQGLHKTEEANLMKQYIQHGKITTYDHVWSVACLSFYLNRRLRLGIPEEALVRGAFLHDFYLYDWHENGYLGRFHGLHHPMIALANANQRYQLSDVEQNIIASHMWPLTPLALPKSKAAALVCFADKVCSSYESIVRDKTLMH